MLNRRLSIFAMGRVICPTSATFLRNKAEGSPDEKISKALHENLAFPYTPHPYTPKPTFKSEGRRKEDLTCFFHP